MRRRERVFACLAILGAFIGGCGLILLSIFDTKRHTSLHRVFLLVFIVGVGLSAIFTVVEVRHRFPILRTRHRERGGEKEMGCGACGGR